MENYRKTAHGIYDCKYHIVWCTKYRYQVMKGKLAERCRDLIRQICSANETQVITGSVGSDHVHLLVSMPPHLAVSKLVQYMKGTTSRKLQQEFPELGKRYWGQHLWARGFFVVTSGNVTDEVWMEYIRNQREEEQVDDFKIVAS